MALLGRTSDNTLRLQHLIPHLLELLNITAPAQYEQLRIRVYTGQHEPADPIPLHAQEDPAAQWWNSADAGRLFDHLLDTLTAEGFVFSYRNEGTELFFVFDLSFEEAVLEEAMGAGLVVRDLDIDTLPDPHHDTDGGEGEGTCHCRRSPWAALAASQAAKARRQAYVAAYCKARHARTRDKAKKPVG